jgi:hypothetical protein
MTLPVRPRLTTALTLAALTALLLGTPASASAATGSTEFDDVLRPGYCAKVTVQAGTPSATVVTVCRP